MGRRAAKDARPKPGAPSRDELLDQRAISNSARIIRDWRSI